MISSFMPLYLLPPSFSIFSNFPLFEVNHRFISGPRLSCTTVRFHVGIIITKLIYKVPKSRMPSNQEGKGRKP